MFGYDPAVPTGSAVSQIDTRPGTARYDLSLVLTQPATGNLFGYLEYRTDLFEQAEIANLAMQFVDLVGEVADTPDRACIPALSISVAEADVPPSSSSSPGPGDSHSNFFDRLSRVFSSRSRL